MPAEGGAGAGSARPPRRGDIPRQNKKVVLAYSGGLDTSVAIRWLKDQGWDVIAFTVDLGEKKDLDAIQTRALKTGASATYVADGRLPFIQLFVWPSLQAGAVYEKEYPLATALGRPLIAAMMVEVARREGAQAVAHGCTGKGNDQVRFDVTTAALAPDLQVVAPVREWNMNRDDEIEYASKHGIEVPATTRSPYSTDENLWGRSIEAGVLEDPWAEPPKDVYAWTRDPRQCPDEPTYVEIAFKEGIPVALDGKPTAALELVTALNKVGGESVVGRKGPHQLYQLSLATYGKGDQFDQTAAAGFIKLWGLGVRTSALVQGRLQERDLGNLLGDVKRLAP